MVDWNALDYSTAPSGYRELRTSQARVDLPRMTRFVVSGRDHRDWLQGQATNDLRLLDDRPWLDFCVSKPTGQILALCRAWGTEGTVILATHQPSVLIARAEETVILEDVVLREVQERFVCMQGPQAQTAPQSLPSDRTGLGGVELPEVEVPEVALLSADGYSLATLEAGIPLAGIDYTEKTLPPELGPHFESGHVSYTKGCYVGQEVLMRIKARGHTNKTWVGLKSDRPMNAGDRVTFEDRVVGTIHRAAHSPAFGHIASATLRNEATKEGTRVKAGETTANVVQIPFLR